MKQRNYPAIEKLVSILSDVMPVRFLKDSDLLHELASRWSERQRFWHGPEHLLTLIREVMLSVSGLDREVLLLAALYHDAVYCPRGAGNEEASARLLRSHAADESDPVVRQACNVILASDWATIPESKLGRLFFEMDTRQLSDACPLGERLAYERAIFREYQWAPWPEYREKRVAFLRMWGERFPSHRSGTNECVALLDALNPRVAVYPGSFNPFHDGHLSVLRQAELAFEKVIIAVGVNRQKTTAVESLDQRHAELRAQLHYHEVAIFPGLLSGFLNSMELPVTVVRGVRDGTDLEAELRFARFLNELRANTAVVWMGCEPEFQHVSSSAIRELEALEPGAGARYVPTRPAIYGSVA